MVFSFSGDPSSEGERDEDDTGTSTEEETEEEQPSYPTSSLFIFSTLNMDRPSSPPSRPPSPPARPPPPPAGSPSPASAPPTTGTASPLPPAASPLHASTPAATTAPSGAVIFSTLHTPQPQPSPERPVSPDMFADSSPSSPMAYPLPTLSPPAPSGELLEQEMDLPEDEEMNETSATPLTPPPASPTPPANSTPPANPSPPASPSSPASPTPPVSPPAVISPGSFDSSRSSLSESPPPASPDMSQFPVGCYLVAVYEGEWHVGQVVDKKESKIHDLGPKYVHVNFMEKVSGKFLKWPARKDIINVFGEDILFQCHEPTTFGANFSTGRASGRLSQLKMLPDDERTKADYLLRKYKGTYW